MVESLVFWFLILLMAFGMYMLHRITKVSKIQQELIKFVFDRSRDGEWDFQSYRTRLSWLDRDCGFDYMTFTFWVWPPDRLTRGRYRDDFLEWKRYRPFTEVKS